MYEESKTGDAPEVSKEQGPRVQLQPHPLGGIAVIVRDPAGDVLATRIDLPEATILAAHLDALITMAFQAMYAEAARAQQITQQQEKSVLIVPGGK